GRLAQALGCMKIVLTRLLTILGVASLAACELAYSVAADSPSQFYTAVFWFAAVLLLLGSVWAFSPVSRRSLSARIGCLFAAALHFLVLWVLSSQLTMHVMLLLRSAHAP